MKFQLCLAMLMAFASSLAAQVPVGETVFIFPASSLVSYNGVATYSLMASTVPLHVKIGEGWQSDPNSPLSTPLSIFYDGTSPLHLRLLECLSMGTSRVSTHHFALVGDVRSEHVLPGSFLEMWSHFASPAPGYPESSFFSRTLAESGPMGKLDGTSDWRSFWLPFDATGTTTKLVSLEMYLSLAGPGTVSLRNLKLVQYPDAPAPAASTAAAENSTAPAQNPARPEIKIVADLPIDDYKASDKDQKILSEQAPPSYHPVPDGEFNISYPKESDGTTGLLLTHTGKGEGPYLLALLTVPQKIVDQISGNSYGIMGDVSYDVKNGALCMASCYSPIGMNAPKDLWFQDADGSRWGGQSDRMGHIGGSRESGPFYLGFTRGNSYLAHYALNRLVFNVVLEGPGPATVHLRDLKLVQYSEPPPTAAAPTTPLAKTEPPPARGLDGKSFVLGIVATGVTQLAWGGVALLARRRQRVRHERELRRIASLDG